MKIDRRTLSENKIGKAGAKKKADEDKAIPVQVYIKQKIVNDLGGIETARDIARNAILSAKPKKG